MAIAKTIIWLSNNDTFSFYYEDYDSDGNLTDSGYNFNDEYSVDMEISSDDGVYLDDIGSYTKDDDGNKNYHTLVRYFQSYPIDFNVKNKFTLTIKDGDNETTKEIKLSDFDKDGFYNYSDDDLEYSIYLINKTISFKCKNQNGSKTILNVIIPNYEELFMHTINRTNEIDFKMFMQINQRKLLEQGIADVGSKYDSLKNQIDTNTEDIKNNDNSNKNEIEDTINKYIFELVSVNGNIGSMYAEGVIVAIDGFNGEWKILQQTVYRNDRKMLLILYSIEGITENVNKGKKMLVDEKIIRYIRDNE